MDKKYTEKITGSPPSNESTRSTAGRQKKNTYTNRCTYAPNHELMDTTTSRFTYPPCTTYSSTAVCTYSSSSRCVPSSYAAHHGRVVKAPWVQKTKVQNASTTHSHEPTRHPTHPRTTCYSSTAVNAAAHMMRWYIPSNGNDSIQTHTFLRLSLCRPGVSILTILRHPGERAIRPREDASPRPTLAKSVIGARPFAGVTEGCRVGRAWHHSVAVGGRVELGTRSCCCFSKIQMTTTALQAYYITG